MSELTDKLIVALDVKTLKEAEHFVDILYPQVKFFKVGSQLFTAYGPKAVEVVGKRGAKVFLDLKFHDIPNTVFAAVCSSSALGIDIVPAEKNIEMLESGYVFMLTVHTQGGFGMMKDATRGAEEISQELNIKKPYIVGVTVLTSESNTEAASIVLKRAEEARDAGLDGVVCSPLEAKRVREKFGSNFIIVTPGIRSAHEPKDDQKRTATAREAIEAGADFIVVGRPILKAKDPLKAIDELFR